MKMHQLEAGLSLCLFLLVGCSSIQKSQIRSLQKGASENEVVARLGKPKTSRQIGTLTGYSYEYGLVYLRNGQFSHAVTDDDDFRQIVVEVEGFAADEPQKKIAHIIPMNKGVDVADIEFRQYASMVQKALEAKGYEFVSANQNPQIAVLLNYGISDPQHRTETHSIPVYDYIEDNVPAESTTTHSMSGSYGQNLGKVESKTTYGNPYAIKIPNRVYRGERSVTKNWTEFTRFLVIEAFDYPQLLKRKNKLQLWKFSAVSTGRNGDLRAVMPALVAAGKDFIGEDTGSKQTVRIWDNDPALAEFSPGERSPASPRRKP